MDTGVNWMEFLGDAAVRLAIAAVIFIVGRWLAKLLRVATGRMLARRSLDPMLVSFVEHVVYAALMVFVILAALAKLGIQTASFVAVIGAAGLAIGLALQGSLANFAAGFLLVMFRPFKVGDYIEGGGTAGSVEAITIFTTQLKSPDNRTIIVPNAQILGGTITNYTARETRRVDMVFGVAYSADIDHVKRIIGEVVSADPRILADPPPTIAVTSLADSSVNFVVRPWVKTADYWDVFFSLNETLKKRFDGEGIGIPFPQMDVHVMKS